MIFHSTQNSKSCYSPHKLTLWHKILLYNITVAHRLSRNSRPLCNPHVRYRVHNNPATGCSLSHLYSAHIPTSDFIQNLVVFLFVNASRRIQRQTVVFDGCRRTFLPRQTTGAWTQPLSSLYKRDSDYVIRVISLRYVTTEHTQKSVLNTAFSVTSGSPK